MTAACTIVGGVVAVDAADGGGVFAAVDSAVGGGGSAAVGAAISPQLLLLLSSD